jgi:hypothetical protein
VSRVVLQNPSFRLLRVFDLRVDDNYSLKMITADASGHNSGDTLQTDVWASTQGARFNPYTPSSTNDSCAWEHTLPRLSE